MSVNELRDYVDELHALLIEKKLTVATAESLTGGMIGAALTSRSGSSAYFEGSIVAYTLEAKVTLLKVDRQEAEATNCVSAEVADQMALGARDLFGSDCAIAVTGYAEIPPEGARLMYPHAHVTVTCGPLQMKKLVHGPGLDRAEMRELVTTTALHGLIQLVRSV